jgi:fumarate hydratase class II
VISDIRTETDSLGKVDVAADKLWARPNVRSSISASART